MISGWVLAVDGKEEVDFGGAGEGEHGYNLNESYSSLESGEVSSKRASIRLISFLLAGVSSNWSAIF